MVLSNGFFYERIQLDTINERFNKVPTAKEGDANGRGMIVVLTENGLVKNTTGVSLLFKWEHTRIAGAQGLEDFEPLDLTKGEYIVTYPTEMNHEGYVKAEIRIIDNGKYAGSRNMKIQVEPSVGDDTAMESSNQFSALVTALLQVNSWNTTIDGKIVEWEDDMAATKQLYIDTMNDVEATYPQELLSLGSQLADIPNETQNARGKKPRGIVTFVTDDANGADLTTFKPIFDRQGVKFNTCAVAQRTIDGGGLSIAQLKTLQDDGHEILSHGYNHLYMASLTDQQIEDEMKLSKEYFNNNGLKVESIAIPYGDFDDRVLLAAQKYYRAARVSLGGITNSQPITTHELRTTWIETSTAISPITGFARNSLEHYKKWIDIAFESGTWLIISTHSWEIATWGYETLMEDIVAYAKTKMDIVTVSQGLDIFGNVVESNRYSVDYYHQPHFALSPNGEIASNLSFFKILERNSVDLTTSIDAFENFRVSRCVLINPTIAGLPESSSGILDTYKFENPGSTDKGYSWQEFKLHGQNKVYRRTVLAGGTWGAFYNGEDAINQTVYKVGHNVYTSAMLPSEFPMGKKTIATFASNTAGMPFTNSGSLEVDFIGVYGTNYGYGKQIAKPYNLTDIYVRSAQSATTWSPWVKFTGVAI